MKQLGLFAAAHDEARDVEATPVHWKLFVDGASRNNPGPAGAGAYLLKDGEAICKEGIFLGSKTNNEAEYLALLYGLYLLSERYHDGTVVTIISDSELLVKQIAGLYRVRKEELKPLHRLACSMITSYGASVEHVLRGKNTVADGLANEGIDKKKQPPAVFIEMLHRHEIIL